MWNGNCRNRVTSALSGVPVKCPIKGFTGVGERHLRRVVGGVCGLLADDTQGMSSLANAALTFIEQCLRDDRGIRAACSTALLADLRDGVSGLAL
jgi:hypothetical protein